MWRRLLHRLACALGHDWEARGGSVGRDSVMVCRRCDRPGQTVLRPLRSDERWFRDRAEAGEALLESVQAEGLSFDVGLAIPRGGLPVAEVVAAGLHLPLDVLIARKVGTPGQPELAMGAVTRFGAVWNESLLEALALPESELERCLRQALEEVERREAAYRGSAEALGVSGRRVLLVDDGLATGATMAAAAQAVQSAGAESVVVGVPVAPADAVERIKQLGASVVSVSTPPNFFGIGQFYQDFGQVPDEECIEILERTRGSGARHTETNEVC